MLCPVGLTLSLQRSSEPLVPHSDSGYYNRSFSLNKQQMRRTVREGYCMLINQSSTMIWIRRIIQLLLAFAIAVVFYFTGFTLLHATGVWHCWCCAFTVCGAGLRDWFEYVVLVICCFVIGMLVLCSPNMCGKFFRHMPAPYEFRVWAVLDHNQLSLYYTHKDITDEFPPEMVRRPQSACTLCGAVWCCVVLCAAVCASPVSRFMFAFSGNFPHGGL